MVRLPAKGHLQTQEADTPQPGCASGAHNARGIWRGAEVSVPDSPYPGQWKATVLSVPLPGLAALYVFPYFLLLSV